VVEEVNVGKQHMGKDKDRGNLGDDDDGMDDGRD
jgi:hypothetical protein